MTRFVATSAYVVDCPHCNAEIIIEVVDPDNTASMNVKTWSEEGDILTVVCSVCNNSSTHNIGDAPISFD